MADKDVEGVLQALEPVLAEVVVTRSSSTRGMEPSELAELAEDVFGEDRVHVVERLDEAIATAVDLAEPRRARGGIGFRRRGRRGRSVVLAGDARALLGKGKQ